MSPGPRRNARWIALSAPQGLPGMRGIIALLALLTMAGLLYAFTAVRGLDYSYRASRALETQRELRESGRKLLVELNHLRAPERLEREAANLGLAQPTAGQVRRLK